MGVRCDGPLGSVCGKSFREALTDVIAELSERIRVLIFTLFGF